MLEEKEIRITTKEKEREEKKKRDRRREMKVDEKYVEVRWLKK